MKVNVNIELWDNMPASKLDKVGLTTKFLEVCYQTAFERLVKEMCADAPSMNYTLSVEVVDNTEE
jgi:hypothetical protein